MFDNEIAIYESCLQEYTDKIIRRFNAKDLAEYNEILFSAHSCAIEGNSFSVDETRALKEKGLELKLQGKSLYESFEILDHFTAFEYLFDKVNEPLTESLMKETHRLLTEHTLSYRYPDSKPGDYTNTDMGAGDTIFGDHEINISKVPRLLDATQKAIDELKIHPIELSAQFHRHFIFLHPFRDGNGRLGRLLSNFILQKLGKPIIIIESENKADYISVLRTCRNTKNTYPMVDFFFKTAINNMKKALEQKEEMNNASSDYF